LSDRERAIIFFCTFRIAIRYAFTGVRRLFGLLLKMSIDGGSLVY